MTKSATDVMQEIIFAAVLDAVAAMKAASMGVPNNMLRDLNALHPNTTFADLPAELQAAIQTNVRGAFTRLLKEGYNVSSGDAQPQRRPAPREGAVVARGDRRGPASRPGGPSQRPGGGPRPNNRPPKPPRGS